MCPRSSDPFYVVTYNINASLLLVHIVPYNSSTIKETQAWTERLNAKFRIIIIFDTVS